MAAGRSPFPPEDVAALFPTADAIVLFHRGAKGQFSSCFVGFPTAAEAQEAASRRGLTLKGQAVVAYIKGLWPQMSVAPFGGRKPHCRGCALVTLPGVGKREGNEAF